MACCYAGCSNTRKKNPDLTFFRFPKERYRCYLWLKKCDNSNIQNLSFSELQYRVVCEEHFSSKCFDVSHLTSGKTRRSLFKFALPEPASVIALKKEEEKNDNNRPTALLEPSALPMKIHQSKGNDLASPSLLMSMAENLCPMMRPISPTPSDPQDDGTDEVLMSMLSSTPLLPPLSPVDAKPFYAASAVSKDSTIDPQPPPVATSALTSAQKRNSKVASKPVKHGRRKILASPPKSFEKSRASSPRPRKYLKILPKYNPSEMTLDEKASDMNMPYIVNSQSEINLGGQENPTTQLILDNNSLETLPTICTQFSLTELSLANNKIDNLIWFSHMTNLKILKLSNNRISNIEVLSKLSHLLFLDLSGNQIASLLKYKPKPQSDLQHLDLSDNQITEIGSLKNLSQLTKLFLHRNQISSLRCWGNLLPFLIRILTLADNSILNLQDISELLQLEFLESLTVANNPCFNEFLIMDSKQRLLDSPKSFNYIAYILYWCPSLTKINGTKVTSQDSLKVKLLKKDSKIRKMISEEKGKLLAFLSSSYPPEEPTMELNEQGSNPHSSPKLTNLQERDFEMENNNEIQYQKSTEQQAQVDATFLDLQPPKRQEHKRQKYNLRQGCTSSCNHYIELIEEKARCYKLQRRNEELSERIQLLEAVIDQNGITINDAVIKIEEDEELC